MKAAPLFYIQREGTEAGPYDLVQMAGLLRRRIIDGETPTRLKGEDAWKPFSWQPQFTVAREMPTDAVSTRTALLDEEAAAQAAGPIPMPSRETMIKLGAMATGALLGFMGAFLMSWISPSFGTILLIIGGVTVAVAQCLIFVRLTDEDGWTLVLFFIIPLYDIYYFLAKIWKYYDLFAVKYIGLAIVLGALAGRAIHH